jgi:hypothetical protein
MVEGPAVRGVLPLRDMHTSRRDTHIYSTPAMTDDDDTHPFPKDSTLRRLDELSSPITNPLGVALCFNLVLVLLFACLGFLLHDKPDSVHLWIFTSFAVLLWIAVNATLFQVARMSPGSSGNKTVKTD